MYNEQSNTNEHESSSNQTNKRANAFDGTENLPLLMRCSVTDAGLSPGDLVAYRWHGKHRRGLRPTMLYVTRYGERELADAEVAMIPLFAARVATDTEVEDKGFCATEEMHGQGAGLLTYILDTAAQRYAKAHEHMDTGVDDGSNAESVDGLFVDEDNPALLKVLDALVAVTPARNGQYMACCPAHNDRRPSLSIGTGVGGKVLLYCFAGCDTAAILAKLGMEMRDLMPPRGCTLAQYANAKKLDAEWLQSRFGLCDITYTDKPTIPAIRIPYYDEGGSNIVTTQYRLGLHKPKDGPDTRFKFKSGNKPYLYNVWNLKYAREQGYVVLVEGASDVHSLQWHGIPSIGVPGASNWRDERDALLLHDIEKIYVIIEPDTGGTALLRALTESMLADRIHILTLPNGYKDASALHVATPTPTAFSRRWAAAVAGAVPLAETERVKRAQQAEAALVECRTLAETPNIIAEYLRDLDRRGVTGERRTATLLYLALTSRVLRRPANVVVKAVSSAGKSYLVEEVLKFFPEAAYMLVTAMSEKAIVYSKRDYRHIFIVIAEANALENQMVSYLIRTLLSEQRLRYHTVEKVQATAGSVASLEGREIVKEGPTGVIVTTTSTQIHAENETRHLSATVDDSPEQTKAVLHKIAERRYNLDLEAVDLARWQALQTWLGAEEAAVVVPYAKALMTLIPPLAVRLRRDMDTVLSLIEAHALLHRRTRACDEAGRVVATLGDYEAVRNLVAEIVAEGVEATVAESIRKTVEQVVKLRKAKEPQAIREGIDLTDERTCPAVSLEELKDALDLDKSVVSRRVAQARERGFIRNLETRPRQTARLVPGVPMATSAAVLPTVEALRAADHAIRAQENGVDDDDETA